MKIEITLNGTEYHIEADPSCFIPYKHGTIQQEGNENFGQPFERVMGYPSTLSRAIHMIIREEMATSEDTVSLLEYVKRYENAIEELKKQVDFN